ncbi:MAG: hypothetical protein OXI81_11490 [Paracoccaceae bacterium]|nr:hypothetical protein [Paracoccaceae bacterium]
MTVPDLNSADFRDRWLKTLGPQRFALGYNDVQAPDGQHVSPIISS